MAFRGKKRVGRRKKGFSRRRKSYGRRKAGPSTGIQNTYRWFRWSDPNILTLAASSNSAQSAHTFRLSDILDYLSYTPIFDQYKLCGVVCRWRLIYDPTTQVLANQAVYPDIYVSVDHDDDTALTVPREYMAYSKCKNGVLKPDKWFTYSCKPTMAAQVFATTILSGYSPKTGYIDCVYATVPHYGIKVGIFTPGYLNAANDIKIEFQTFYKFMFKNAR